LRGRRIKLAGGLLGGGRGEPADELALELERLLRGGEGAVDQLGGRRDALRGEGVLGGELRDASRVVLSLEYANVSHGTPIALRVARDMLRAEEDLKTILVVAACRESYLLDYTNERSRFMFNFGDGAVAGLLVGDGRRNEILGTHAITHGAYSLQVKVPGGGSVDPAGYPFLDVQDPAEMKGGLDQESLPNFLAAAQGAVERSGLTMAEVAFVCPLHTKRSMFVALLSELGMREDQAVYLDDTGHMSGVDSLLGLDRAVRDGRVHDGDAVLLLSAGTGYTWAATVVRWGEIR